MPGPWEKYQQPQADEPGSGPWAKYAGTQYDESYGSAPVQGDGEIQLGDQEGLEIPIVGGTPIGEGQIRSPLSAQVSEQAPSVFNMDRDTAERFGIAGAATGLTAAAKDMFGSEKGVAEYLAKQSGGRVVRSPDGGYGLILPDGSQFRINEAGLDSADVANVAGNVAASFLPASWAARAAQARNIGLGGRALIQGATAGAFDSGAQLAADRSNFDPMRTAFSAAGGAAGEVVGTGISALAGKAGQLARARSGVNQSEARALMEGAGVPASRQQIQAIAPEVEQIRLGADPNAVIGENLYGFQYTQGQRLTDPSRKFAQLSREEVLRQSPGGNAAFAAADRNNSRRLGEAIADIGEGLGATPAATPAEMVQGAASRLQAQASALKGRVDEAYAGVRNADTVAIGRDSVASVPDRLRAAVADFDINPATTPGAARALDQVRSATSNLLGSGSVRGVTLRAAETQRRILNNAIDSAANKADRAALLSIKREFDSWLDEAVDSALVSGDPEALAQLKNARGLRAEFYRRFEGGTDADKFIAGLLDGSKTPEELLNVALGASQVSKAGGARFINRLRTAANNDPEVMGGLRAAHFARLTTGKNGEPLDMGRIINNIKATEYNNASVSKALYSPAEWGQIKSLAKALEPLVAKGEFKKSSGSAERGFRMLFDAIGGGMKGVPLLGDMLFKPLAAGRAGMQAEKAVSGKLAPQYQAIPGSAAVGSSGGQELERQSFGR